MISRKYNAPKRPLSALGYARKLRKKRRTTASWMRELRAGEAFAAAKQESEERRQLWKQLARTARPRLLAAVRNEQRKRFGRIKRLETCDVEILAHAIDTFESANGAARWLTEPTSQIVGFGGRAPVDLLGTKKGRDAVHQELFRIDYGIPP